ncbi:transcriptional regulator with XRE-family HTH domain [Bradyrhizobium sp. USDA 4501]
MTGSDSFEGAQQRLRTVLGRNVRKLRLSLRMTQAELAERAESRRALISDIERGEANPTLDSVLRIAMALSVEASELLKARR